MMGRYPYLVWGAMNNWLGRVIIFFIVGAGCALSLQYTASHFRSDRQLILLNRTRPDFQGLLNIEKQPSRADPRHGLREYFDYFHLVNEAMPENTDGMLMLGYLDQITGNELQAGVLLKEAYRSDPQFFFIEYDLALLLFKQGDYAQSADLLQKALAIPPEQTLHQMMDSVIYRQIFSSISDKSDIIVGLQQAYHDAYVLLIESSAKQKDPQGANVVPEVFAHIL